MLFLFLKKALSLQLGFKRQAKSGTFLISWWECIPSLREVLKFKTKTSITNTSLWVEFLILFQLKYKSCGQKHRGLREPLWGSVSSHALAS